MSSASKRNDSDNDTDRASVPEYPAEVARTWQAFRVTMRDDDAAENAGDPPPKRAGDAADRP